MTDLYRSAGSLARDGWSVVLTPESAGWRYSGLRSATLDPGASVAFDTGDDEVVIVPLAGGFDVVIDGVPYQLTGRASVWAGPSDFLYAPPGCAVTITGASGTPTSDGGPDRVAVATTRGARRYPVRHIPAADVSIELRGAGASSREVRNFASAAAFEADRLIAVEVLSPGGNWGSYPPHKHDEVREDETELEEIYHYVVGDGPSGPGLAYQHLYGTRARPVELLTTVHTGDVVLVPHGWHGPAMAAPGYDLYYLNVMAGPGERAWRARDDAAHAWIRETWAGESIDARLPFGKRPAG